MERFRFQILFYIRKNRKNKRGEYPIYMRVSVNKESAAISSGRYIKSKFWNPKKAIAKPTCEESESINNELSILRKKITDNRNTLIDCNKPISAKSILKIIHEKKVEEKSLLEIYSDHNSKMASMLGHGYAASYFKNHKSTKKHLVEFIPSFYNRNDILINEIDHNFISNFVRFLQTVKDNNHNGAMKNLIRLKKIVRIALYNDWLKRDPFIHYKMTFQKYDRVYLNQNELETFEDSILTSNKLNKVKDIFVFSCYTGLSYADIKILNNENIITGINGNLWISANRKKSGIKFTLPLLPKAMEILKKYQPETTLDTTDPIFPVMSNQKMNQYLKEIAKLCGITKPISFHSARHTFATTVTLVNGVPIETVSKMLGHTAISTTQIYARVIDQKIAADMNVLMEKLK